MINNESVRYLESVRVQVEFPPGVAVLIKSDTDHCDHGGPFNFRSLLPNEPATWGALKPLGFDYPIPRRIAPISTRHLSRDLDVETDGNSHLTRLTWEVGDLRPKSTETGSELFAIVTDDHVNEVIVRWRVTARGVNHVFEDQTTLICAQEPGIYMTWARHVRSKVDEPSASGAVTTTEPI